MASMAVEMAEEAKGTKKVLGGTRYSLSWRREFLSGPGGEVEEE